MIREREREELGEMIRERERKLGGGFGWLRPIRSTKAWG